MGNQGANNRLAEFSVRARAGELAVEPLEDAGDQFGDVAGAWGGVASGLCSGAEVAGLGVQAVAQVSADQAVDAQQEVGGYGGGGPGGEFVEQGARRGHHVHDLGVAAGGKAAARHEGADFGLVQGAAFDGGGGHGGLRQRRVEEAAMVVGVDGRGADRRDQGVALAELEPRPGRDPPVAPVLLPGRLWFHVSQALLGGP